MLSGLRDSLWRSSALLCLIDEPDSIRDAHNTCPCCYLAFCLLPSAFCS